MSYEQHFGLNEQPFSNAADSRFYFESQQHQEAMVRVQHSIATMKGLCVVIGGPGAGKTLLARRVLEKLEEEEKGQYEAALLVIVHSEVTADWLLKKIAVLPALGSCRQKRASQCPSPASRRSCATMCTA